MRQAVPKKNTPITELRVFLPWFCVFVIGVVASEAFLLHRTEQYFGGGAMNRPFSLSSWPDIAIYFGIASAYDLLGFGTSCLLLFWFTRARRFNPLQRNVLIAFVLGGLFSTVVLAKWKIHEYFKNSFDLAVLKELTGGKLANAFAWITLDQFPLLLILPALLMAFLLSVRVLGRFGRTIVPMKPSLKLLASLVMAWPALITAHFFTASHEDLRFGLSHKLSYSSLDRVLVALSDFDHDGFGPLTTPRDPDNDTAAIHPYAVDYPGNGLDEDALAGDLDALHPQVGKSVLPHLGASNGMNVILIVVETFRVDVIGKRIDGREVTPFLNKVAKTQAYTDQAYSNYGVTARAIQSLFKGSLHYTKEDPSIADELRRGGYRTYAYSAQDESWGDTDTIVGLNRFDEVFDARDINWDQRELSTWQKMNRVSLTLDSRELNRHLFALLDRVKSERFFLYINYQDLHYPYHSPGMERVFIKDGATTADFFRAANREKILNQYANAAHHLDGSVRALWDHMRSVGIDQDTVLVIIGDHPDSIYENGLLGHAWTVDEHQRRTPLFVINGKGRYRTPIGQDEIAGIVANSVATDNELAPAAFFPDDEKRIFELSALLEQPRQIAWISPDDLITYDFKTARVQLGKERPWLKLAELSTADPGYGLFKDLVQRWESELHARRGLFSHGGSVATN
ncbi:MAG: sulfatase-like hydrolase/transferase [Gammaproteobacteria bacterium]